MLHSWRSQKLGSITLGLSTSTMALTHIISALEFSEKHPTIIGVDTELFVQQGLKIFCSFSIVHSCCSGDPLGIICPGTVFVLK